MCINKKKWGCTGREGNAFISSTRVQVSPYEECLGAKEVRESQSGEVGGCEWHTSSFQSLLWTQGW